MVRRKRHDDFEIERNLYFIDMMILKAIGKKTLIIYTIGDEDLFKQHKNV